MAAELTASNRTALYVPAGCAHAFLTLADETEVLYQVSAYYTPGAERGIRWDDPWLAIDWPLPRAPRWRSNFPPLACSRQKRLQTLGFSV